MKKLLYILLLSPLALFGQIEYQLSSGWNMVGFTACEITPIDDAFQNALENGATISETFNIIKDVRGEFWHSSLGEYSSLTQLTPGEGYMMYVHGSSTTVQFSEIYCDDITYQLNSGWNMLAYTGTADNNGIVEQIDAALGNGVGTANTFQVIKNVSGQFWSAAFAQINTLNTGQAYMMYVNGASTTLSFTDNSTQVFENNPGVEFTLPTTDNNMSIVFSAGLLDDFIGQQIYAEINGQIVSEYKAINENGSVGLTVIGYDMMMNYYGNYNYQLAVNGDVLNLVVLMDDGSLIYLDTSTEIIYTPNAIEVISSTTVYGCTDANACNYALYAITNDGSCLYLDYDQSLFNACCLDNSISTICLLEDVSCESVDCINLGCMQQWADNYDPFITEDDGSCYRYGCTQTWAHNYDSIATINDNQCYKIGCTQEWADNYDVYSTIDDGSCFLYGCNILCAENYDANVTINDSTCILIGVDESNDYLNYVNTSLYDALLNWNPSIDLNAGWNMFGYGCPSPISIVEGLSNHTESITLVKDNNGSVYIPEFDFNGIGVLTPGFGYQIKLTEAIEGFSLCDWYVNDIPEDNFISLQEENASLQAELDSINAPPMYQVGDFNEGGLVFYVDETGEHGLVAALVDLGGFAWGCYGMSIPDADGIALGTGLGNTIAIVADCSETNTAAYKCLNATIEGYSDWYLPSVYELSEMWGNIGPGSTTLNQGNFSPGVYWSSSEFDSNYPWYVHFPATHGYPENFHLKTHTANVRPIRSF
jgi:hypothetical protein